MQVSATISTLARVATVFSSANRAEGSSAEQKKLSSSAANAPLSPRQEQKVRSLESIDREVRAHEQAHLNAAGGLAVSAARFRYQVGPEGKRYAVAGEVKIDTSAVANNPKATIRKAAAIEHAALAPAQPSPQDRSVASQAAAMGRDASAELQKQQFSNNPDTSPGQVINQFA